jgi:hypothetical protein
MVRLSSTSKLGRLIQSTPSAPKVGRRNAEGQLEILIGQQ